jgi:hypothetical protein
MVEVSLIIGTFVPYPDPGGTRPAASVSRCPPGPDLSVGRYHP